MTTGRVLVVDDQDCGYVARLLRGAGLDALATTDPLGAPELAAEGRYGLVVSDIYMRGRDGRELCRRLLDRSLRCILYSADAELRGDAFKAGAIGFRHTSNDLKALAGDATAFFRAPRPAAAVRGGGLGRGRAVLVIEDDEDQRELVAGALASEGFAPFAAEDGREGLIMAASLKPAAVVLDVHLPDLGLEETLHSLKAPAEPPVVLVRTGEEAGAVERKALLKLGADDYIVKDGHGVCALGARLALHLERGPAPLPWPQVGALRVGDSGRDVLWKGISVASVTPKERVLLETLMRAHPGVARWRKVVSVVAGVPEEMGGTRAAPGSVRVHLKNLRAKLRGVGVRIEALLGEGLILVLPGPKS